MKDLTLLFFIILLLGCQQSKNDSQAAFDSYTTEEIPGSEIQRVYRGIPGDIDEEGFLLDGRKTGTWVTYHPEKKEYPHIIASYVNGKLNGLYAEYNSRGQLDLIAHYKDDILNGRYAKYQYGRILEEHFYEDGKLDGIYRVFFPNSDKVEKEIQFKDNKENGYFRIFNDRGELIVEYQYRDGKKTSGGMVDQSER